jgi:predicted GNAT family acetyltransferase
MEPKPDKPLDPVQETSEESFPASDSPAWAMGEEVHASSVEVVDNEAANRFEASVAGKSALLTYRRTPREIVFYHAEVPPELEGHGIGSKVVRTGLEFARQHGLKVVPLCPFVVSYLHQHQEYVDLVSPDYRGGVTEGK